MEEYKDQPFALIAPHHQAGTREEVLAMCKKMNVNYTIYAQGDLRGANTLKLPAAFLFDHTGRMVESGKTISEKTIAKLVAATPAITRVERGILDDVEMEFVELATQASAIRERKDLGATLHSLRQIMDEDDGASMDARDIEAAVLYDALVAVADAELESARAKIASRPAGAIKALQEVAARWAPDDVGKAAAAEVERLEGDAEHKQWVAADLKLADIEALMTKLAPCKEKNPLDLLACERCQEKNKRLLGAIASKAGELKREHANSPAVSLLADMLAGTGIEFESQ